MRTSLNEIKRIDGYIFGDATPADALLFDAMRILDPGIEQRVKWQKNTHIIIINSSRKKLKEEISAVHRQLFTKPGHRNFRQRILNLFK